MKINMRKRVETDEADARAVIKDPFDWPAGSGVNAKYMGSYPKRVPDGFRYHVALWDAGGVAITADAPNLRNKAPTA